MDKIILEIIPPPINWESEKVHDWIHRVCDVMEHQKIFGLNLSEVINESREGERSIPFVPKMDNIGFAEEVRKSLRNVEPIPSKISVRIPREEFLQWIDEIYKKGIRSLVIVGREKNDLNYPGFSVIEAAKEVKKNILT